MNAKHLLSLVLAGSLGAGVACATDNLRADTPRGPEPLPLPSTFNPAQSFAPLVEALQPAVVNVFVKQKVTMQDMGIPEEWQFFFGPNGQRSGGDDQGQGSSPFVNPHGKGRSYSREGQGSGFLISADGYILTNNHVVADADEVKVKLTNDQELDAKVVGTDPRTDIALIKVDAGKELPWVKLGNSDGVKVGDWVVAIGNPFGLSHTVTAGIVSAKGRVIGAGPYDDFIQTDASINPGNSGGPLFDLGGNVVAINTAIVAQGQGIGFAVPINVVTAEIEELKANGKVSRGWIGVALQPLDEDIAKALGANVKEGALVREVYPDTPGSKAGLKDGDIVTKIDGKGVKESDELVKAVGAHRPGDVITLTIVRDGKSKDLKLTLQERPDEDQLKAGVYTTPSEKKSSGKEAAPKPEDMSRLGIEVKMAAPGRGKPTVPVISDVKEGSPAEGKLQAGDTILEVNRTPVKTLEDVQAQVSKSSDVVLFLVDNDGVQRFVAVKTKK